MMNELEPKPDYCIELKDMWSQFADKIRWVNGDYSCGYVRLGDINMANIRFWEGSVDWRYTDKDPKYKLEMTETALEDARLADIYYWGYKIYIRSLATGEIFDNPRFTINFGDDAYLHKKDWTWKDDYEINTVDLIKKVARGMLFIEAWCL